MLKFFFRYCTGFVLVTLAHRVCAVLKFSVPQTSKHLLLVLLFFINVGAVIMLDSQGQLVTARIADKKDKRS